VGFRAEVCENLRYVVVSAGKRPVSLRVLNIFAPPDVSIPRYRFDPERWQNLAWEGSSCIFELDDAHRQLVERVQRLLAQSPIAPLYGFVDPKCICLNIYRLLDNLRKSDLFPGYASDDLDWPSCLAEIRRRLGNVLESSSWTFLPLKFDRVDCTAITLVPADSGCQRAMSAWTNAIQKASNLRNGATNREMLTVTFAFEVFPVEGENAAQARRSVVRDIHSLLEKEWGTMPFLNPRLASWHTHADYSLEPPS
jgi:hypothetical protein